MYQGGGEKELNTILIDLARSAEIFSVFVLFM
jgi:hypothetical protein